MAFYTDTSALVKLVIAEEETIALRSWLEGLSSSLVASDLVRTELIRAVRRSRPDATTVARQLLDTLMLVEAPAALFAEAGFIDPPELRTLDALHLASALDLGDDLEGIVTYDDRLAEAARLHGLSVIAPR